MFLSISFQALALWVWSGGVPEDRTVNWSQWAEIQDPTVELPCDSVSSFKK